MSMDKPIRTVLVVGVDQPTFGRLEPLLQRASFDVDRVPSAESAGVLLQAVSFDVVIIGDQLEEDVPSELVTTIRGPGSPCRRSAVLILGASTGLAGAGSSADSPRTVVLPMPVTTERLEREVASLLRVAPRLSVRIPIRLEVELADGRTSIISQTENVSIGGMLVRTRRLYPMETSVRFELLIPDETSGVGGRGVVVRHTDERRGRVRGVGVKFTEFKGAGRERLRSYLRRHLEDPVATS